MGKHKHTKLKFEHYQKYLNIKNLHFNIRHHTSVVTVTFFIVCNEIYFLIVLILVFLDLVRFVELCISTACPQDPLLGGTLLLSYEAGYPKTLLIRIPRPG